MPTDAELDLLVHLAEAVVERGGARVAAVCEAKPLTFDMPQGKKPLTEHTQACGCESIFLSPYDTDDTATPEAGLVQACAFCDRMDLWPHYEKEVHDAT